jgi:hypothetical protein
MASAVFSRIGVIAFAFAALTPAMARAQSAPSDWVPPHSVFVHVDSPDPVELQGESGEKRRPFYTICVSPCDTVVPAVGQYRVSGDATRPSRRFVLPEGVDHDTIVVRPASSLTFGLGIVLTAVGAAAAALGALGFVFSAFAENPDGSNNQAGRNAAIGIMIGGGAVAGGGVALIVLNASSKVSQTGDRPEQRLSPSTMSVQIVQGAF